MVMITSRRGGKVKMEEEEKWNSRTKLLIGEQGVKKLEEAKVIIYGIGGVGSFAVEALVRAGVRTTCFSG